MTELPAKSVYKTEQKIIVVHHDRINDRDGEFLTSQKDGWKAVQITGIPADQRGYGPWVAILMEREVRFDPDKRVS